LAAPCFGDVSVCVVVVVVVVGAGRGVVVVLVVVVDVVGVVVVVHVTGNELFTHHLPHTTTSRFVQLPSRATPEI
jgi:hypothetical protein